MRESIRRFFEEQMGGGNGHARAGDAPAPTTPAVHQGPEGAERRRLHVAACALLLELAHADDEFSDDERMHIEAVMRRHFAVDEDTAQELIALAQLERSEAIDLYQFTRLIRDSYDLAQKTLLAEIMWGLILTDGTVAAHEAYMLRKIANLLDLKPGFLSEARKRVAGDENT